MRPSEEVQPGSGSCKPYCAMILACVILRDHRHANYCSNHWRRATVGSYKRLAMIPTRWNSTRMSCLHDPCCGRRM